MKIEINNSQTLYKTDRRKIAKIVEYFLQFTQRLNPDRSWGDISVALVDDRQIGVINKEHLNHVGATDVITFSFDKLPGEDDCGSGDIVVNVQRAVETGSPLTITGDTAATWGASHELALYLAHGCDHLAGEDDATPQERRRMRQRELRWVRKADALQLVDGLIVY